MTPADMPAATADEEYSLPCAEALLAGTLALMTGYVQACDTHRDAMGRKIVANLQNLARFDTLTPHFRTMLWNLQTRWVRQVGEAEPSAALTAAEQRRALWHTAPDALQ